MKSLIDMLYDQLSYFVLSLADEEMGDGWGLDEANFLKTISSRAGGKPFLWLKRHSHSH